MSTDYGLFSSAMRIKSSDWEKMIEAAKKPLGEFYPAVQFEIAWDRHTGGNTASFSVHFSGEAGDSFPEKINVLTKTIGPYLLDAATITLRDNSTGDKRDDVFFAGPTPESIQLAKIRQSYARAQAAVDETDQFCGPSRLAQARPEMAQLARHSKRALANAIDFIDVQISVERAQRNNVSPVVQEEVKPLGQLVLGATCHELASDIPAYVIVQVTPDLWDALNTAQAVCFQNEISEVKMGTKAQTSWPAVYDWVDGPQVYDGPVELVATQTGFRVAARMPWIDEMFYSTEVSLTQLTEHIKSGRAETLLDDDSDTSELQALLDKNRASTEETAQDEQPRG